MKLFRDRGAAGSSHAWQARADGGAPRGLFQRHHSEHAGEIIIAISRRIAALVPQAEGAKELDLIVAGLSDVLGFLPQDAYLRDGHARVCAALGVKPDDTSGSG
jgi:hypothetical protein